MFSSVPSYAGDPILSLQLKYRADPRLDKVNLSIGLYYDERGKVPILDSVRMGQDLVARESPAPGYLPMGGDPAYCAGVQELIFGQAGDLIQAQRVATIQTIGASGALKTGADFLHGLFPNVGVWISAPTWDNHRAIFEGAGFQVHTYPYFDAKANEVAFDALLDSLRSVPPGSVVLMHPCCHNPTGADLTPAQWDLLADVAAVHQLIVFLDMAYQGYAEDMQSDAYAVAALAKAGVAVLVSHSFSKTFSMYAERCGSLSVVCDTAEIAARVRGQLEAVVRRSYSSPPAAGARVIARVLADPKLRAAWYDEVAGMRMRIQTMRRALYEEVARHNGQRWMFLLQQKGLFSYEPSLGRHADRLQEEDGIYILASGRICMAGLTTGNVGKVGRALARVTSSD